MDRDGTVAGDYLNPLFSGYLGKSRWVFSVKRGGPALFKASAGSPLPSSIFLTLGPTCCLAYHRGQTFIKLGDLLFMVVRLWGGLH